MSKLTFLFQRNVFLIASGLSVSLITVNGLPAQAETIDNNSFTTEQQNLNSNIFNQNPTLTAELTSTAPNAVALEGETQTTEATETAEAKNQPVPGTTKTSASVLLEQPQTNGQIAQFGDVEPGRATTTSSYIGIGGNLGVAGGTAVGDLGFTIFAKIGLTPQFSARPALIFNNDFDILLPITYDFRIEDTPLLPFIGGGLLITTGSGNVGGLISAGLDFPISRQFTATGRLNVGFTSKDAALGFIFGLGYNFTGF
ncbi:hypothetical protein NIES2119_04470 [[Phormidium ambiguum] IAM M-71]|uniref:Outer membrane protein beta-barrel domain-containing protein n=1 Tax=[Phormidium ambiguum] IAM M-71 TaxID=454136 RepID=A0A1U7IRV8_9CYAN|nr:hypothetical protein [Phormidium ambiguum]OKH40177.1 hypothetical protein NIES2119_04470 [Phormidium ambiguum IAM M-71]